ncbi:MAG: S8 family serine peptidase [Algoriphagus sp.]|nr:S8 family serine peptidase [Algoriphagus sp.]
MKKLILSLLLFSFTFSGFSQESYVVILNESPVVQEMEGDNDRQNQSTRNLNKRNEKLNRLDAFISEKKINVGQERKFVDGRVGFVARLNDSEIGDLSGDPRVKGVYMDFKMQSRPMMQSGTPIIQGTRPIMQSWNYNESTKASCAIDLAGGSSDSRSRNTSVWVIDSGVDQNHLDLRVNSSQSFSKSFVEGEGPYQDFIGHGTHCAGIIGGTGAGNPGVTGVSAGADIISVKVLDRTGEGSWSSLVLALDHVIKFAKRGDVILMSLGANVNGCSSETPVLGELIQEIGSRGIFVVMSAGNDSGFAENNLPGCVNGPNVFTVGSLDSSCQDGISGCSSYSNFGAPVDWAAPGNYIFSTFPGNSYQVMSGSSMSAALVAGIIHARNGAPNSIGSIDCGGASYQIPGR